MPNVKGTALLPAVKMLRKNREKSESYLDDVARKMCTQRILPGSWYPMEQADPVMVAVTKFIGGNPRSAMEDRLVPRHQRSAGRVLQHRLSR
jgi:hypothetical protein